jgi:hypothetical protein
MVCRTQTTSLEKNTTTNEKRRATAGANHLLPEDHPVHDWYRFVLSYPPHLVRHYIGEFGLDADSTLVDPFCGTGTTMVEAKKLGIPSIGIEAHPFSHFASETKTDWTGKPGTLLTAARDIAGAYWDKIANDGVADDGQMILAEAPTALDLLTLPSERYNLLLANSISHLPLHKSLRLVQMIDDFAPPLTKKYLRLALAKALCGPIGNLHFGPEVGVGPAKKDAPVLLSWMENVGHISADLEMMKRVKAGNTRVHNADSRAIGSLLGARTISAVITSPPYPNEKDYTRTTRLESVLLGFVKDKLQLRILKQGLVRSNTRNVYVKDDDDAWVRAHPEIQRIAEAIESRRIELGKTSGFE